NALAKFGGKLLVYAPFDQQRRSAFALDLPNVELRGFTPWTEMLRTFRQEADALVVPVSFQPGDRRQTILSFPSKLADYTAAGLPLLIFAPEYSSAARWARANPGVAEIVDTNETARLDAAMLRLTKSPAHRWRLAHQALATGRKDFSHCTAWNIFCQAIRSSSVLRPINSADLVPL